MEGEKVRRYFKIVVLLLVLILCGCGSAKEQPAMLDWTFAMKLVDMERQQVNELLGDEADVFETVDKKGLKNIVFNAGEDYMVEGAGTVNVQLQYQCAEEEATLRSVTYHLHYHSQEKLQTLWKWIYTQRQGVVDWMGRQPDYVGGHEITEQLDISLLMPGTNWNEWWTEELPQEEYSYFAYSRCVNVSIPQEGLLVVEIYSNETTTQSED